MATDHTKQSGNRGWVEHWVRIGPELERIRREELRRYRHEDNIEIIDSLLDLGLRHAQPRTTSGLVELQRLLHQGELRTRARTMGQRPSTFSLGRRH